MKHPDPRSDDERQQNALVQTLTLVSSVSTAARVMRAVHERRSGQDPSGQEAADAACPALRESLESLQELLVPLFVAVSTNVYDADQADRITVVRKFEELHRMSEALVLLHRTHQRLLSLYPGVPESVVEEARSLHHEASAWLDTGDRAADQILPLLARILGFSARLDQYLQSNNPA